MRTYNLVQVFLLFLITLISVHSAIPCIKAIVWARSMGSRAALPFEDSSGFNGLISRTQLGRCLSREKSATGSRCFSSCLQAPAVGILNLIGVL